MLNPRQDCIVVLVLVRLEELRAAHAQRGALQIGGNHLKEADASACPCDVDLANVASQQANATQEAKTDRRKEPEHRSGESIDVTRRGPR